MIKWLQVEKYFWEEYICSTGKYIFIKKSHIYSALWIRKCNLGFDVVLNRPQTVHVRLSIPGNVLEFSMIFREYYPFPRVHSRAILEKWFHGTAWPVVDLSPFLDVRATYPIKASMGVWSVRWRSSSYFERWPSGCRSSNRLWSGSPASSTESAQRFLGFPINLRPSVPLWNILLGIRVLSLCWTKLD